MTRNLKQLFIVDFPPDKCGSTKGYRDCQKKQVSGLQHNSSRKKQIVNKKVFLFFIFICLYRMLPEKYIGLTLAMCSSVFIGLSFVITKKGLVNSRKRHGKKKHNNKILNKQLSKQFRRISG